ncbi:DUF885 domain-containing protein [Ferrimonas senticii]|uniref:DUF885 domain-containing protein n=1 Tax=Ferrimonas senticii TaxID=394566 RepID=UPI000415F291|nr:DUF885 domain-containing protein [Ferrimonas senticii]
MDNRIQLAGLPLLLALAGCQGVEQATAAAQPAPDFDQLAQQYFDDTVDLNPLWGTYVGRAQYNNRMANPLSDEHLAKTRQLNQRYLALVQKVDVSTLTEQQRLSRDILEYQLQMSVDGDAFASELLPLNQFYNRVITMVQLGSGQSAQPFVTEQDYDNYISRMHDFGDWADSAIARLNQGSAQGVVLPKTLINKLLVQLDGVTSMTLEQSPLYGPLKKLPANLTAADADALASRYRLALTQVLLPSIQRLQDHIAGNYLAKGRSSSGWGALPNGGDWYQYLANTHTTTTMSVANIHQLGLDEVARIRSEMDKVRQSVGFDGDLAGFFNYMGNDPQFFFSDEQDLVDGYDQYKNTINAVLPKYFDLMPKADYIVKPVEKFRQQSAAGASYQSPAPDGSRPGIFYVNTYNLKAQPKWGMMTLSLHEAAPGHHFQIALKQELENVPDFQRFGGYTAFAEGWALYAEELGIEMGLFSDPYQYFGKLSDEMLRAMRLVVDTGLHAKGWSREQAIQYMTDNSPMAESDVVAEVERYMAIPGQALSYKIGQLTIMRLRAKAEAQLGDKFDLRQFHNQVLSSGSLPMAILENKIDRWVASQV